MDPSTKRRGFSDGPAAFCGGGAFKKRKPGGFLLSQRVAPQVPSASEGLTTVFGMGTGVTLPVKPPGSIVLFFDNFIEERRNFITKFCVNLEFHSAILLTTQNSRLTTKKVSQASRPISTS